jgi:hypothetical protein
MKINDQVASLKLANELKELGVKQDSVWCWVKSPCRDRGYECRLSWNIDPYLENYSAYTVAELGEMLKNHAHILPEWNKYCMGAKWFSDIYSTFGYCQINEETEADARAKMLIYLIKEGTIKAEEIGK